MKFYKMMIVMSLGILLTACSGMQTRTVNINPSLSAIKADNIGRGRAVAVTVTNHIANIQNNPNGMSFILSPNGTKALANSFQAGLQKLGFTAASREANPSRELIADLRMLMYYINTKNNTRYVVTSVQVTVSSHGKSIEHSYQSRIPAAVLSSQPEQAETYVNKALAAVITQVLQDDLMMMFLAN